MINITVNGGLPENSLKQSSDSNGEFEQRSRPCSTWVWPQAFHMEEMPPSPLPLLSVRLHMGRAGRGSSHSVPSPRGVCCSILMTKKGAGARSRYHTLICLRRGKLTIQSAGVHRNPVKAEGEGGCINDKRQK